MMDQHAFTRDEKAPADVPQDVDDTPAEQASHGNATATSPDVAFEDATEPSDDVRPFANVTVADFMLDIVAALALLVSLALPWNLFERSADRVEVVLTVALALASLSLPYLARFAALPVTWTVYSTRRARLLAGIPLAVVSLVHLVIDARSGAGVGTGLGLAIAGAALAATPRDSELGPADQDWAVTRGWRISIASVGVLITAGTVTSLVFSQLAQDATLGDRLLSPIWLVLTVGLVWIVVRGTAKRDRPSRLVLIAIGLVLALLFVFTAGEHLQGVESMRPGVVDSSRFGLLLFPLAAALAVAPAVRRDQKSSLVTVDVWVRVAIRAFDIIVLLAGCSALAAIAQLIDPGFVESGVGATLVVRLVLSVVVAVIAWLARRSLHRDPGTGHVPAVGAACVTGVLGLVVVIVTSGASLGVDLPDLLMTLGLPGVAACALMVPQAVREHFQTAGIGGESTMDRSQAYVWAPPRPRGDRQKPALLPEQPTGKVSEVRRPAEPRRITSTGAVRTVAGAAASQRAAVSVKTAVPVSGGMPLGDMRTVKDMSAAGSGTQALSGATEMIEPVGSGAHPAVSDHKTARIRPVTDDQPAVESPWSSSALGLDNPEQVTRRVAVESEIEHGQRQATAPLREDIVSGNTAVMPPVGTRWSPGHALDPATPLEDLAKIVQEAPHLRPQVAANPSTYPALLEWLGALGDPHIDAALRNRH